MYNLWVCSHKKNQYQHNFKNIQVQSLCVFYHFVRVWTVEIVKSAKTTKDANELIQQSRSCCHSGTQVQNEKEWSLIWTADDSLFFHLLIVYRDCVVTLRTHIRLWEVPFFMNAKRRFSIDEFALFWKGQINRLIWLNLIVFKACNNLGHNHLPRL